VIERAYLVHYGNALATLCRDLGQAEKTLRMLHGTKITELYELTNAEIEHLRAMPREGEDVPR
jgi:hypothetical protein